MFLLETLVQVKSWLQKSPFLLIFKNVFLNIRKGPLPLRQGQGLNGQDLGSVNSG
jgi:hypothetical protein